MRRGLRQPMCHGEQHGGRSFERARSRHRGFDADAKNEVFHSLRSDVKFAGPELPVDGA
jgi:hypothetical protein